MKTTCRNKLKFISFIAIAATSLLWAILTSLVGCQSDAQKSSPSTKTDVAKVHKVRNIGAVIAGKAFLVSKDADGKNYKVSFELTNISDELAIMHFGPVKGTVDGHLQTFYSPGVGLNALINNEWESVEDGLRLGDHWKGLVQIKPGEQFVWTVEFHVSEATLTLLKADTPLALALNGYAKEDLADANVSGDLLIPIVVGENNSNQAKSRPQINENIGTKK